MFSSGTGVAHPTIILGNLSESLFIFSPSALSAQGVNKQTGFKQVGQQEEEEEGRGVGMEQVSDPPGDLALDTPAKGKGGKETREKRPAK